jgi:hypothetical protein
MVIEEISEEPRQRYDRERIAEFVDRQLERLSSSERAKWSWLPNRLRQHWAPFFYVTPSTRIVDLVRGCPRDAAH